MKRHPPTPVLAESTFRTMLDNTNAIVFLKDRAGRYVYSNRQHRRALQRFAREMVGRTDLDIFPRKIARAFRRNDRMVMKTGRPIEREESAPVGKRVLTFVSLKFPVRDRSGKIIAVGGIATDISRQKSVEAALRESEERYRLFTESAKDYALAMLDEKGRVVAWDKASERIRGFHSRDILGKYFGVMFRQGEQRRGVPQSFLKAVARKRVLYSESLRRRRDGSLYWLRQTARVLKDERGRVRGYAGVAYDATEERRLRNAVSASRHLIDGEEAERRRISRELHDGLNQVLSSAKHRLLSLGHKVSEGGAGARRDIESISGILDLAIREVRRISRNLSPAVLDDLGLAAAIRTLFDDVRRRTGLSCRLTVRGNLRSLPKSTVVTLYRIVQEASTNCARHAGARRLGVLIRVGRRAATLEVTDDGCGFRADTDHKGQGLRNMRERTLLAGGRFHLDTARGRGTAVRAELPL